MMPDARRDAIVRHMYRDGIFRGAMDLLADASAILEFHGEEKIHTLSELAEWLEVNP